MVLDVIWRASLERSELKRRHCLPCSFSHKCAAVLSGRNPGPWPPLLMTQQHQLTVYRPLGLETHTSPFILSCWPPIPSSWQKHHEIRAILCVHWAEQQLGKAFETWNAGARMQLSWTGVSHASEWFVCYRQSVVQTMVVQVALRRTLVPSDPSVCDNQVPHCKLRAKGPR